MSDCKGCKYWTKAIEAYAKGDFFVRENKVLGEPNPICSTCEGDKYQARGAVETKASLKAENGLLKEEVKGNNLVIESLSYRIKELSMDILVEKARTMRLKEDMYTTYKDIKLAMDAIDLAMMHSDDDRCDMANFCRASDILENVLKMSKE